MPATISYQIIWAIFSNWIFYIWIKVHLSATARWSLDVKIVLRRQMAVSHVQSCPFFATQTPKLVMRPRIAAKRGAKPTIGNYFFAVYIVHTLPIGFKLFLKEQYDSFELVFLTDVTHYRVLGLPQLFNSEALPFTYQYVVMHRISWQTL